LSAPTELRPIRRLLIANRGEIALRIIRTCRKLGIESVLCVSAADRDSVPARMATRALCIGPAPAVESYLKADAIVQAALSVGADAIHPGYGFLSERSVLAKLCEQNNLIFVGPTSGQIEAVGDKLRARAEAVATDVPVVPGGRVGSTAEALALASELGVPVLIKAVGGGGGRGMKLIEDPAQLSQALDVAMAEAGAAFGDARVYLERYVARGRHVEVQVLGDGRGAVVHLGERDCSMQRRYQKLIEESPAPGLSDRLRADLHAAAIRYAARLQYRGAGTVEFLVDTERDTFYFLEMNARIQVEHPVTELVTGIDLIAAQLEIAAGAGLPYTQEQIRCSGWAMECRINAEDPANAFMPSPGIVTTARWPEGDRVRVDTHIVSGSSVPPYYDSMIAKIIVAGRDRTEVLVRMNSALSDTHIEGVRTNLGLQRALLRTPVFEQGLVDTGWLDRAVRKDLVGLLAGEI
jgi:acetyl-CoA carboxylase biotin carboxylase subunit